MPLGNSDATLRAYVHTFSSFNYFKNGTSQRSVRRRACVDTAAMCVCVETVSEFQYRYLAILLTTLSETSKHSEVKANGQEPDEKKMKTKTCQ